MSAVIQTPVNQVRLTNVSIVRYRKSGKRFEIACYPNKVLPWREGVERDLDEVLQSPHVFTHVSKGVLAKQADMEKVFKTSDEEKVCRFILEKGDLQVTQKERKQQTEALMKDVATHIANVCVNKDTRRPFPVRLIENALKEIQFSLKPNRSAKQQALAAMEPLKEVLPLERARMRLRCTIPKKVGKAAKADLEGKFGAVIEEEDWGPTYEVTIVVDPGMLRGVEDALGAASKGKSTVEILDLQVRPDGDRDLD